MRRVGIVTALFMVLACAPASAQLPQLEPPFAAHYSVNDLGIPPGVSPRLGGLTRGQDGHEQAGEDHTPVHVRRIARCVREEQSHVRAASCECVCACDRSQVPGPAPAGFSTETGARARQARPCSKVRSVSSATADASRHTNCATR